MLFEAGSCYVLQVGLKISYVDQIGPNLAVILLPLLPETWNYRYVQPCLACTWVLGNPKSSLYDCMGHGLSSELAPRTGFASQLHPAASVVVNVGDSGALSPRHEPSPKTHWLPCLWTSERLFVLAVGL